MNRKSLKKITRNGTYYRNLKKRREQCENSDINNPNIALPDQTTKNQQVSEEISSQKSAHNIVKESMQTEVSDADNIEEHECFLPDHDNDRIDTYETEDEDYDEIAKGEPNFNKEDSREAIRKWAIDYNISHQALKGLLSVIKHQYRDDGLPSDPRTLLATPQNTSQRIIDIPGGRYWHQGLEVCLKTRFKDISESISIELNVNMDGIPIHKSSKDQFWPILCNVYGMPQIKPMIIGIFLGKSKPLDVNAYLSPFIDELLPLMAEGVMINNHKLSLRIRCFICDSPARAFVKGVINFNGINGCLKCTTEGEYSHTSRTVTFPNLRCAPRTDEKFRLKQYGKHHKQEDSPILKIPDLDIIKDFVVADSLHLLELGVMKRCLTGWRDGKLGYEGKLCARDIEKLTNSLLSTKLPSEIHRSMRGMDCLSFWKGVEWRSFLNYVGIVILKDVLNERVYNHFLLLFVAVTICSNDVYKQYLTTAQLMFEKYVEDFKTIYGVEYITSNIHNLEHVVDDVNRFGSLQIISAYPFENSLFQLKKLLRQGNRNLEQVVNRIHEQNAMQSVDENEKMTDQLLQIKQRGKICEIFIRNGFMLSNVFRNAWFMTKQKEIVKMKSAICDERGQTMILGKSIARKEDFFIIPVRSSFLYIYVANKSELNHQSQYNITDILCKLVAINYNDTHTVFIPLLHTF